MFSRFLALLGFLIMILKTIMFDLWIFIHKIKRCFLWKTGKTSKTVTRKFWEKFSFASFDRSRIPFDRSNVLFNWSKRNREPIDSGRNSMMKFFIVSINWEFLSIDECYFRSIKQESRINQMRQWLCDEFLHFFDRSRKRFDQSKALNFEFSLAFWLSVKTLIKGKVVCDEITHDSI